ncbi:MULTISPECIES: hypothetical protein [Enterobacter cloacae complex]|uniref:hypothetical protein n=1 Tax=Enterobacter cloacae complex TaxID=354276 RepID=UPI0006582049|nr:MULTISPECIES: hypothetical protein [Enterobacter cloacae complex]KLW85609.1 hypothetical protein SK63_04292 [Enterobacter sp. BIDMC110]MDY3565237.1 hypothetical protein [Enterobacter hormaechei]
MKTTINLEFDIAQLFDTIRKKTTIRPPIEIEDGLTLIEDFEKKCNKFRACLDAYIESHNNQLCRRIKNRLPPLNKLQSGIIKCLECFLSGDIKTAYDTFDLMLKSSLISRQIEMICIPLSSICNDETPLFRVRKSDRPLSSRKDMFHIPFKQRHLVKAQRYSVAGLPCLYLGTSLYICWREMDKPDFDKLYISSFKTQQKDNSLLLHLGPDFLYRPSLIISKTDRKYDYETKLAYLALWPLIIACNYLKQHDNASFNQEYIIPNLLMQWISRNNNTEIAGIAYRSTKLASNAVGARGINVVMPPKIRYDEMIKNDFCPKLCSVFKFTLPVSWQVLKTLDYRSEYQESRDIEIMSKRLRRKRDQALTGSIDDEILSIYNLTDFFKLEICMDEIQVYAGVKAC